MLMISVGSKYSWSGNDEVGTGSMTIVESIPNERILIRLEFTKPFVATNSVKFTFEPQGGKTLVTWSMEGSNNFIAKAIDLFLSMDNMVGSQFDQGLAQLKDIVESKGR